MKANLFKFILVGILIMIGQIMIFRHLRIFNAEPDLVLVFILWVAHHLDRTRSLLFAAVFGLLQDALLDLWGLNMFAKTAMMMICYNLIPKSFESKPQLGQIITIVFGITFLHNLILIGLTGFVQSMSTWAHFTEIIVGNTVFTTFVGVFLYFFKPEQS